MQVVKAFRANGVHAEVGAELSSEHLKKIGAKSLAHLKAEGCIVAPAKAAAKEPAEKPQVKVVDPKSEENQEPKQ